MRSRSQLGVGAVALALLVLGSAGIAAARVPIDSTYGSGNFGLWAVDRWGLPSYDYKIDQNTNPIAVQPALGGSRDGWNSVANAHDKVDAHTDGRMQFWSQDRLSEWANHPDPAARHYTGGWGYLRVGGRTIATDYDDLPAGVGQQRQFGVGYFHRRTGASPVSVDEYVYAPFGDDPLVLHDVTLHNRSRRPVTATWWEYWDVDPLALATGKAIVSDGSDNRHLGVSAIRYRSATKTLVADQDAGPLDRHPLAIFASALNAPVTGHATSTGQFFGDGSRAAPEAVTAGHATPAQAPSSRFGTTGSALFAFKTTVRIAPGKAVTLRYGYGMAHPRQIRGLLARYRAARDPLGRSMSAWRAYVPQVSLGPKYTWLSRELQWDAYLVKSNERYEELCHTHVITQGGYYQYAWGNNIALRDPLEHELGLMLIDPQAAKETLVWALQYQPGGSGDLPYGTSPMCRRNDSIGTADELNFWLILGVVQYVENTRDTAFLNQRVRYYGGGSGTVWQHLKLAYRNQEHAIGYGPHGSYLSGTEGDTFDLTTSIEGMRESISTTGNFAYIYPVLAGLASSRGADGFANQLRDTAARLDSVMRREWQPRGWFARGYTTTGKLGVDTIFGDGQYWPLAAGIPTPPQQQRLMANVKRYLDGFGAPRQLHGPSKIGPMELPAKDDPGVGEQSTSAYFPGRDMWWFVDGPAVWAFLQQSRTLPGAAAYAWSIFRRFTLASHAASYPNDWSGVISADDTCAGFTGPAPGQCGLGISGAPQLQGGYSTQITHSAAWTLFDAFKLAGIEGDPAGYSIEPHLPVQNFTVRTRTLGVTYAAGLAEGYVRPLTSGTVGFTIRLPAGNGAPVVRANGRSVKAGIGGGQATFDARATAGRTLTWSIARTKGGRP